MKVKILVCDNTKELLELQSNEVMQDIKFSLGKKLTNIEKDYIKDLEASEFDRMYNNPYSTNSTFFEIIVRNDSDSIFIDFNQNLLEFDCDLKNFICNGSREIVDFDIRVTGLIDCDEDSELSYEDNMLILKDLHDQIIEMLLNSI